MPIVYGVDTALGCTIAIWDGDLTSEDMHQQLMRLANDPAWPPGPHHLVDATSLGTVIIPDPELLELLYEGTNLVKEMRIAIVLPPDSIDAATRYESTAGAFDAARFTDLASACAYLGLNARAVQAFVDRLRQTLPSSPS
jgi:hypothetical protein